MNMPRSRFFRVIFRLSLLLNMVLIPYAFMKDHLIYFFRHSHSHDWITQPVMNSSWYKSIYQVERTTGESVLKLYQLMKDVHDLFEKHQVTYWVDGGTLLGAIRHQGIIPWDGDLDIAVRFEDGFRFQKMKADFEKLGYEVDEAYFGFKIYLIENPEDRLHNVCCDVFMMAGDGGKFIYYSPSAQERWPIYIREDELFPLTKYRFGDVEVWGPNTPDAYLTRLYGNWRTQAYKGGDHLKLNEVNNIPFALCGEDLEPGKPTGPLKDRVGKN